MSALTGKVAVITGGTSGIGLATALTLAADGATVYIAARHTPTGPAAEALGKSLRFIAADAANEQQVQALFAKVRDTHGRVDIVVASHGTLGVPSPVADQQLSDFKAAIDINLVGTFLVAREAARALTAGGSLVLVASTVGNGVNFPGVSAYAASKAAVVAFVKSLALELSGAGVRVNALVPGGVDTPMFRSTMGATPESAAQIASLHAMGRVGRAEELAAAVRFLAGDAASFITGSALVVDGGMTVA